MDPFRELSVRGEALELPARFPRGPTPSERRFAAVLERHGDLALAVLPFYLALRALEVFEEKPVHRFSFGRVEAGTRVLEVEGVRGEPAHGGGGQIVALCRSGDEIVLPTIDLSIFEARELGERLDAHVRGEGRRPTHAYR
jgi:hypothetical protein